MTTDATKKFVVELSEKLDIASAEELHLTLEDAIASGQAISLQGGSVCKVDTAAVQVLSAFCGEAGKLHIDVEWVDPSDAIRQVFSL
ncbi:MAG: anti-anti-sigma regulatory factor [Candidatus Azotimanducaceae bacterium]|jgi:anti-anti-sigma regulatory factor